MTPEREAYLRSIAGEAGHLHDLLTALDEVRAREARLREAADAHLRTVMPNGSKVQRDARAALDAALADPDATTWLAGRERAASAMALRGAADELDGLTRATVAEVVPWLRGRAEDHEEPPR